MLWIRIRKVLNPFISTRKTSGVPILNWRFQAFKDEAKMKYLCESSQSNIVYTTILDYFQVSFIIFFTHSLNVLKFEYLFGGLRA